MDATLLQQLLTKPTPQKQQEVEIILPKEEGVVDIQTKIVDKTDLGYDGAALRQKLQHFERVHRETNVEEEEEIVTVVPPPPSNPLRFFRVCLRVIAYTTCHLQRPNIRKNIRAGTMEGLLQTQGDCWRLCLEFSLTTHTPTVNQISDKGEPNGKNTNTLIMFCQSSISGQHCLKWFITRWLALQNNLPDQDCLK